MGDETPLAAPGMLPETSPRAAVAPAASPESHAPAPQTTHCANHPARTAIGRCPTCRRLVCDECHVRLDGILHCSQCLRSTARTLERNTTGWAPRIVTTLAGLVVALVAVAAVRGALTTAGFLGGRGTRFFAAEFERGVERAR